VDPKLIEVKKSTPFVKFDRATSMFMLNV